MRQRHFSKMDSTGLWLTAAIILVIITQSSSQTIQQLNNHSPSTHLKMEQIRRTKQNTSNASMGNNMNSETKNDVKMKTERSNDDTTTTTNASNKPHSRKKRLIWITDDGRLALPPGTVLSITPTISLPLVRYPLEGFLSNMTMSFPLTIDFDKLGLTDNENPLGVLPPLFARSMGRAAGTYLADYIGDYLTSRKARSLDEEADNFMTIASGKIPTLPDAHKHAFHGGERAILYGIAEDFLSTFGVDGKACLLRTICEIHSKKSLDHLGFLGEIAKLFLTATKSNYAHLMTEYVTAQQIGEGKIGPGECFPYYKKCPKSIFKSGREASKYRDEAQLDDEHLSHDEQELNELDEESAEPENSIKLDETENEISAKSRDPRIASSVFNM